MNSQELRSIGQPPSFRDEDHQYAVPNDQYERPTTAQSRAAGERTAEMTSNKQCIHKQLLNVSLVLNVVSLGGLVVIVIFISLLSQRTAMVESDIDVIKDEPYVEFNKSVGRLRKGEMGVPGVAGPDGQTSDKGEMDVNGEKGIQGLPSGGSVFTRWRTTSCPSSSNLLYSGIVGNANHATTGGGVEFLCLPLNPEWLEYNVTTTRNSYMGATHYASGDYGIFPDKYLGERAVCAQCYAEMRSAILMIPARITCPANWQREYYGYLMASQHNNEHPSSYVCVDNTPEFLPHSSPLYGAGFAFVIADSDGQDGKSATLDECDSGEYVHNRQITCVVCSR